jgi:predicted Zn-dependent peptidase
MFLEPEPTWALDTTVVIRGPVDATEHASIIEAAFASPFAPAKAAALAAPSRASIGKADRHLLVGWASGPVSARDETAAHLAFILACHNKVGRLHRALRHDRTIAARANCSLEVAPQGSVAWVFASPALPHSVADAEKAIDEAVQKLVKDGPSEQEVLAARGLLRTELARERDAATMRGLPKSRVVANNERILSKLDRIKRADVMAAAKVLFDNQHRIVVAGD